MSVDWYGAADSFSAAALARTTNAQGYEFDTHDLTWDWVDGQSFWFSAQMGDGTIIIPATPQTVNTFQPTGDCLAFARWTPTTGVLETEIIPTSTGVLHPVSLAYDPAGGADFEDCTIYFVDGEERLLLSVGRNYNDWWIGTGPGGGVPDDQGVYPCHVVLRNIDGVWTYDEAESRYPADYLASNPTAAANIYWTATTPITGESITTYRQCVEVGTFPESGHIVQAHYDSRPSAGFDSGAITVVGDDGSGLELMAGYLLPNVDFPGGNRISVRARSPKPNPSSSLNDERFVLHTDVFSDDPDEVFNLVEMTYDAGAGTIEATSQPFWPGSPNTEQAQFDEVGNLYVSQSFLGLYNDTVAIYEQSGGTHDYNTPAPSGAWLTGDGSLSLQWGNNISPTTEAGDPVGAITSGFTWDDINKVMYYATGTSGLLAIERDGDVAPYTYTYHGSVDIHSNDNPYPLVLRPLVDHTRRCVWIPTGQSDPTHPVAAIDYKDQWVASVSLGYWLPPDTPPPVIPSEPVTRPRPRLDSVRFLRESILTGEVTEIELDGWSYTDTLNRPGALSASVPINSVHATEELLDPWRTAIYAVRGTNVEWGGVLLPPSLSVGSNQLDINCLGWLGYWDHRVIRNTVGQPEAGGLSVFKPNADATTTDVFGIPNTEDIFTNVAGGYSRQRGIWSDFAAGSSPAYQARFDIPDSGLTLHPIASVRLGIVATGVGGNNTVTPRLVIGGVNYDGTTVNVPVWAPWIDCSYTWTTNPETGDAWIPADIYAFASSSSAGYVTGTTSNGLDTVVNQLSLTVSYDAGFSDFFTDTDQFEIFRSLILDAQSEQKFGVGYDLGIDVVWDELSGVERDRTAGYQPHLAKNLGEALRQLGALEDGFDYAMEYQLNPITDGIDKNIRLYYPRKGRDSGFLFEYERGAHTNIMSRGFADPIDFAWTGDGWGSGNDATRLRSPYVDEALRTVYPPYDAAPTFSNVVLQTTLDEHTNAAFARTNRPKRVPVITVDPGMYPQWGDYTTGDVVNVRIDDGYGSTANNTVQQFRVTGTKVSDGGAIDLVLADPLGDVAEEEG